MLNIATVGTSAITEKFIAACRFSGRFKLYAAYSRSKNRAAEFAKKHGFEKSFSDLTEMACDPQLDAVYIATPNVFHAGQSKLFLENGKHVLCEKPITTDSHIYKELSKLADAKKLIYTEAIISRHSPGRSAILSALPQIGRISQVRIDYCQRSSRYDRFMAGEKINIFDMSLGAGTLADLGVYCVYAAADLLGVPQSISAHASFFENGADCAGGAIFGYKDFSAALTYSKIGNTVLGSEIIGDSGALKIASVSQYNGISLVKDGVETPLYSSTCHPEIMGGEVTAFADYIENPKSHSEYREVCRLTADVHEAMDLIKQKANIKYPLKECII